MAWVSNAPGSVFTPDMLAAGAPGPRRLVGAGKSVPTPTGTRATYLEFNRAGLGQPTTPSAATTGTR